MTKSQSISISLSRREALASVSAAAVAIGIGAPGASASAAAFDHAVAEAIDMIGHVPAYNAPISFGRPKTSAALIDDPYDLIFA